MIYREVEKKLNQGCIVKSQQCMYIKINNIVHWCWIGENSWTEGEENFNNCVNESEKSEVWEIIFDPFSWR